MQEPSGDDLQDKYIDLVAANWTQQEYDRLARTVRYSLMHKQWTDACKPPRSSGQWTTRFHRLWCANIDIQDEIVWRGFIAGVEQPDAD